MFQITQRIKAEEFHLNKENYHNINNYINKVKIILINLQGKVFNIT